MWLSSVFPFLYRRRQGHIYLRVPLKVSLVTLTLSTNCSTIHTQKHQRRRVPYRVHLFTEEQETEDEDYRDENELSGGEEPEWETDEMSSEAVNDTSVEDSLQDTSRDKEGQMESESASAAANQGGAPRRKSPSTRRNLYYSRICTERLTLRLSVLKAKLVRICEIENVRVVLKRLPEVRRRMTLCSKEKVELGVTTLLSLPCFYVFSIKRLMFPQVTSPV